MALNYKFTSENKRLPTTQSELTSMEAKRNINHIQNSKFGENKERWIFLKRYLNIEQKHLHVHLESLLAFVGSYAFRRKTN